MTKSTAGFTLLLSSLLSASTLVAQTANAPQGRNEVGLVIGGTITPAVSLPNNTQLSHNAGFTLGAEYDYRLLSSPKIGVSIGVDFFASPFDVKLSNPPANVSPQYAFLFLTPHVRVAFKPDAKISPWLLFGGGYANFAPAAPAVPLTQVAGGGSTGTFEFGGGIDTKPFITLHRLPVLGELPIGSRFEVRDFYSGVPNYGVTVSSGFQNQIAFTGGLLLHF